MVKNMLNDFGRRRALNRRRRTYWHDGLSTLETIGCVVAVAGGICLGALYAGVDLRQAAHTALDESELLESVPLAWRPDVAGDKAIAEKEAAELREEHESLSSEIAKLSGAKTDPAPATATTIAARDQTLAYWQAVNQIAFEEAAMQSQVEAAFAETNAAKVFAIKARACRYAANALDAVKATPAVDASAVKFSKRLQTWYESGAEQFERAVQIWESPTGAEGRTQLNEEWNNRNLQHRSEAALIAEKGNALSRSLSRQYGAEFPGFAQPIGESRESSATTETKQQTSQAPDSGGE